MVLGWRRAFCTSISKDQKQDLTIIKDTSDPVPSPRLRSRFGGFFSNPSTPRLETQPVSGPSLRCRTTVMPPEGVSTNSSASQSVKLHCQTGNSPRFFNRSTPSSPRSPSTFSILKSSLRLAKSRCGICLQGVKTGGGTAIFTAECGHSFHFPCISSYVKKQGSLACPVCSSAWKELHLLNSESSQKFSKDDQKRRESEAKEFSNPKNSERRCTLKVYNDDEPLSSRTSCARFNPIPESDETEEENDEFPGFYGSKNMMIWNEMGRSVEIAFSPEVAVISAGKTSETYAVSLKIKAPAAPVRSAPIDLVTVLNVSRSVTGEKLHLMKRAMRLVVSSLSEADRLSIVAFSTTSKRLLPMRRMSTSGKKSARMIIDAVVALDCAASSPTDSLKKAAKVIEDRREKNLTTSILLFTDGHRNDPVASFSRLMKIPVHSFNLGACVRAPPDSFAKYINSILSTSIQDLEIQLVSTPGSPPYEIPAVYSYTGRPAFIGSGSSWCRVGDFHSEEEKELLVELKVPSSAPRTHRFLSVRCSYKDPSTLQRVHDKERFLPHPRPRSSGSSSTRDSKRLKCLFIATRAVAESRRLVERNDIAGAQHMLASARALVSHSGEEFVRLLESELSEVNQTQQHHRRKNSHEREAGVEPMTPTSAWRTAERLAKVAIMKKSLNRVSDLHGFEDARF